MQMQQEQIRLVEAFYEVYSRCVEAGWITPEDYQIVQQVAKATPKNQEQRDMVQRVMRGIERRRIAIVSNHPLTWASDANDTT